MAKQGITSKMPNQMSVQELMDAGKTLEQAKKIMADRTFGADHKVDAKGNPIEQGIGSEANPFKATHLAAKKLADAKEAQSGGAQNSALIAAAVEAGVRAGLAAAKNEEL